MAERELTDRANDYRAPDEVREDPHQQVKTRYQILFDSQVGSYVLADMMIQLGLFAKLDGSLEQATRHNYAIELLGLVGILKPDDEGVLDQVGMEKILDTMMKV
tara:strand:+ start:1414 stop:1725 length:312 start_codon:yes stop_codon:yes gene_type:complete